MEEYQFVIVVLPDLSPKCAVYSKSLGLDYKDLLKKINANNILKDCDLYLVTPSWIEKTSDFKNMIFGDEFMKDFPKYRLQFYPRAYPQYIFRFRPVVKEKTIEIHTWNAAIDLESNVQLDDFLKAFSKTFFVETSDLKFEYKDPSIKLDSPILSQKELIKKNEIELTFSITDHEYSHAKKRMDVLKEIRTSEERYVADLQKITENFTEKIFIKYHIDSDVYRRTFKSVSDILPIHSSFLKSLQKIGSALETSIGPLFLEFIPYFKVAAPHVANFSSVIEEITDLVETNRSFGKEIFQICRSEFKGNTVESLLVTPVQRIPRYPLLLKELLKCVPDCHWDKDDIQLSFNNLTKLNLEIDQKTSEQKSANAMAQLQKKLGNSYKVLTGGRHIISTLSSDDYSLYLFNDLLLIQLKHEDSYKFKEFPLITTKVLKGKTYFTFSTKKNVFSFPVTDESQTFVENFSKTKRDFLLKKCTFDGSLRWSSKPCKGPPELKSAAIASILFDLYLFGGKNKEDGTVSNQLWWFHKDEWELVEVANAPKPRYDCTMNVFGTSLIVFGGHDNENNVFDDLLVFDIPTASWIIIDSKSNMKPTPRFGHASAFMGSQLWIYGGKSRDTYFNDLYCFDFNYYDWWKISTPKTPEPRAWATAFWIPEKILKTKRSRENGPNLEEEEPNVNDDEKYVSECGVNFAIFGGVYKSATYRTIWMFDYDNVDWVEIETQGDQPTARFSHVSAQFNNALYIIGGRSMQDNSLDPYRLDMTTKPYTWSVLPQSDEPNSFDNGACCVIDDFGLALYNTTLYFIKFKQDYKNPEPAVLTNEVAMTKNKFEGTRLSRPIYNIESNVVTTYIDHPRSTFDFGHQFPDKKIDSIMKRTDDGSIKWKEDSVLITGSILLDESFFICEDDGLQKILPPVPEVPYSQFNIRNRTSTNIPFFNQNKKPKSSDHMIPPRRTKTMCERSSFNPNADAEKQGIMKRDSVSTSASAELQYGSRNSMFNKDTSQMNFGAGKQNDTKLKSPNEMENLNNTDSKSNSPSRKPPILKSKSEQNANQQNNNSNSVVFKNPPISPEKINTQTDSTVEKTQQNLTPTTPPKQETTQIPAISSPQQTNQPSSTVSPPPQQQQQENQSTANSSPQKTNQSTISQTNSPTNPASPPATNSNTPQSNQTTTPQPEKPATNPASPTATKPPPTTNPSSPQPQTISPVKQLIQQQNSPSKPPANSPPVTNQKENQTTAKTQQNSTATSQPTIAAKPTVIQQQNPTQPSQSQTNQQQNPTTTTQVTKPPTNVSTVTKPQQTPAAVKPQTSQTINANTQNSTGSAAAKPQINQAATAQKPQTTQTPTNTNVQKPQQTATAQKPPTNQPATTTNVQKLTTTNVAQKPQTNQTTTNAVQKPTTTTNASTVAKPQTTPAATKPQTTQPPTNAAAQKPATPTTTTQKPQTNQPTSTAQKPQTSAAQTKPQANQTTTTKAAIKPQTSQVANTTAQKQSTTTNTTKPQTTQPVSQVKQQSSSSSLSKLQPNTNQGLAAKSQQNQASTIRPQTSQAALKTQQNQAATTKPQLNQPAANKPQQNSTQAAAKPQQNAAQKTQSNQPANKPQQNPQQTAAKPTTAAQTNTAIKQQQANTASKTQQAPVKPQQPNTKQQQPHQNAQNRPQQNQTQQSRQQVNNSVKPQQTQPNKPQSNVAQNKVMQNTTKPQQNQANKSQQNTNAALNKTQPNSVPAKTQQTQPQPAKPAQNSQAAKPQTNPANKTSITAARQQNPANKTQQANTAAKPQTNQTKLSQTATTQNKTQQTPANKPQQANTAAKPPQAANTQNKTQQTPANKPQQANTTTKLQPNQTKPPQAAKTPTNATSKPSQPNQTKPPQTSNTQNKPQQANTATKPPQAAKTPTNATSKPSQPNQTKPPQTSNTQNKPQQNTTNATSKPSQPNQTKPPQTANTQNKPQQSQPPKPQQNASVTKPPQNQSNKPTQNSTKPPLRQQSSSIQQRQQASQTPLKSQSSQNRPAIQSTASSKQQNQKQPQSPTSAARQIQPPLRQVSTAQKVPLRGQNGPKTTGAAKQPTGAQNMRKNGAGVKSNSSLIQSGNAKMVNRPPQNK